MTILYTGVEGLPPLETLSRLCFVLSALVCVISILVAAYFENPQILSFLFVSVALIIGGLIFNADFSKTIVKATIDPSVSWLEVNEKYKLIKQEGEIYTFQLKEETEGSVGELR